MIDLKNYKWKFPCSNCNNYDEINRKCRSNVAYCEELSAFSFIGNYFDFDEEKINKYIENLSKGEDEMIEDNNVNKKYVYVLGATYGAYDESNEIKGMFETEELAKEAEKKVHGRTYITKMELNKIERDRW